LKDFSLFRIVLLMDAGDILAFEISSAGVFAVIEESES
jgi:hypothetical protein